MRWEKKWKEKEWGVEIIQRDKIRCEEWREKKRNEKENWGAIREEKKIGEERRRYAVRKKCERFDEMRWDEMRWDEMRWEAKN